CGLLMAIDLAVYRLPDVIVGPMYPALLAALVVAAAVSGDWGALGRALAAAGVLLAGYFALAWINPSGLGLGDVKLSGPLGAFLGWLGWPAVVAGTLAAFVINAVIALVLLAAARVGLKSGIAFGPAMVVGAAAGAAYWAWRTSAGLTCPMGTTPSRAATATSRTTPAANVAVHTSTVDSKAPSVRPTAIHTSPHEVASAGAIRPRPSSAVANPMPAARS